MSSFSCQKIIGTVHWSLLSCDTDPLSRKSDICSINRSRRYITYLTSSHKIINIYSLYINRQGCMASKLSRFTNKRFNKYKYNLKTVKGTKRKITTNWTLIILLPCHKQTVLQNSRERRETDKRLWSFSKILPVSMRDATGPSNRITFLNPKEYKLIGQ